MRAFVVLCSLVLCFASVSAVRDEGVLNLGRAGYPAAVAVAGESLKNGTPPPPATRGYGIGLDVSQPTSVEQWECLNDHFGGLHGVIVRAWRSVGNFDPNALETIKNAKAAGINRVDVYMFPCIHVDEFLSTLKAANFSGDIWLDVEGQQYWTDDCATNLESLETLLTLLVSATAVHQIGVYASEHSWLDLMCGMYTPFSDLVNLWYPHYDNNYAFSDWHGYGHIIGYGGTGYGGWHRPHMKQYVGSYSGACNAGVDISSIHGVGFH